MQIATVDQISNVVLSVLFMRINKGPIFSNEKIIVEKEITIPKNLSFLTITPSIFSAFIKPQQNEKTTTDETNGTSSQPIKDNVIVFYVTPVLIVKLVSIMFFILTQILYQYVGIQQHKINDTRTVTIPKKQSIFSAIQNANNSNATISGSGANSNASGFEADNAVHETITYTEYDMRELDTLQRSSFIQGIVVILVNMKFTMVQPMTMFIFTFLKSLIMVPLILVYVWGLNLRRPFNEVTVNEVMEEFQRILFGAKKSKKNKKTFKKSEKTTKDSGNKNNEEVPKVEEVKNENDTEDVIDLTESRRRKD